eukprot:5226255-Amphidinium_carterae.2
MLVHQDNEIFFSKLQESIEEAKSPKSRFILRGDSVDSFDLLRAADFKAAFTQTDVSLDCNRRKKKLVVKLPKHVPLDGIPAGCRRYVEMLNGIYGTCTGPLSL